MTRCHGFRYISRSFSFSFALCFYDTNDTVTIHIYVHTRIYRRAHTHKSQCMTSAHKEGWREPSTGAWFEGVQAIF